MSGRIEGLDEALADLSRFGEDGIRGAEKAVFATAMKVRTDAIKSIQRGTKSGKIYKRGPGQNLSGTHQASDEGEAPATDTGTLVNSLQVVRKGLTGFVFSTLNYAFWLEYGTLKMEERPFLRPAVKANEQYFLKRVRKEIDKAVERANK